ncbi:MAG: hypothetical protein KF752_12105 [Pirellulaceae bacterium]|nr:hypothetical protein [Pirellulaceae bacterium]
MIVSFLKAFVGITLLACGWVIAQQLRRSPQDTPIEDSDSPSLGCGGCDGSRHCHGQDGASSRC